MEIRALYDIPGFAGLRDVTTRFGCELTVFGGFVRRVCTYLRDNDTLPDPEELAYFSSDIDMIHSGKALDTAELSAAVIETVPFGEAIRWQIRSIEENALFEASAPFNGIVPANLMSLNTSEDWGVKDPWHGSEDIKNVSYRYIRNGFYRQSPLFIGGRDLEIFSSLLYFKVLVDDVKFDKEFEDQPGLNAAKQLVHSVCSSPTMLMAFQDSSYLRGRLLYLLKDLRALEINPSSWKGQIPLFGLDRLAEYLNQDEMFGLGKQVSRILESSDPILISARLGGDQYRLPDFTEEWSVNIEMSHRFRMPRRDSLEPSVEPRQKELAPRQAIVASSPRIRVNPGRSSSSKIGRTTHEFIHAAIPFEPAKARQLRQLHSSNLSVLMELAPSGDDTGMPVTVSVPCVCSVIDDGYNATLYVRVNALGFLEDAHALTRCPEDENVMLQTFVVAPARSETNSPQGSAGAAQVSNTPVKSTPADPVTALDECAEHSEVPGSVVFIHGILSESEGCFAEMRRAFKEDERFAHYDLLSFDYDYNDAMEKSAAYLTQYLKTNIKSGPVFLVCHSMGGLVARLCVLSGEVSDIKRVVMLGTPNFGAVRTAQLGLLSQLSMHLAGKVYAIFRKPGIKDLTRVASIFKDPIQKGRHFADKIEYVTIPGEFFNESRPFWDVGNGARPSIWTGGFAALGVATEILTAAPLWRVGLQRPHDGIVEAVSNSFIPCSAGRTSEKCPTINHPDRFGRTYVHVTHECCSELTHVMIQHDPSIILVVKDLVAADSISIWYSSLDLEQSRRLRAVFS
jgi:pimeloyl-ACP methyl ester carboxylesterase